jgi:hypothetical protein
MLSTVAWGEAEGRFARMGSRSIVGGGVALVMAAVICGAPAEAALGRAYATVEADRAALGATLKSTSGAGFTLHTLTLANGGVVTEYTRSDGTVFAIAWRGSGRPDLRTLLGDHFDTLQADNPRIGRRTRRPLSVNRSDLQVVTGGHSGALWGMAVLPQLKPASFSFSAR